MRHLNNWNVSYSTIAWFEDTLRTHNAVTSFRRVKDINFLIVRKGMSSMDMVLVNKYAVGMADLYRAREEFPNYNCLVTGGDWNGYTQEAKQMAVQENLGLFNSSEFLGALWKSDFSNHSRKDEKGNPTFAYKSA